MVQWRKLATPGRNNNNININKLQYPDHNSDCHVIADGHCLSKSLELIKLINLINTRCAMEILNASDAKREFGEVLIKAQHGPIGINRNGKPVAVVISAAEFAQLEALKEEQLKMAIQEGIADLQAGKVTDGKIVMDKLRKRVSG